MKNLIAISILLGFSLLITLNSCKKKEEEKTPAALTSTATIKGKVWADLDLTNAGSEAAPAGTKLFVTIDSEDLVDNPQYDNKTLIYEASVDANGNYSISVPAGNKAFNVRISGVDFEYNTILSSNPQTTSRSIYSTNGANPAINAGTISINDIYYN